VVTRKPQVERRTAKVRLSETDVLPLSHETTLVHWSLMGGCYVWYNEEGSGWDAAPPSPLLAVPNVTANPSMASVSITVLISDGPLLCDFNVAFKGLN